MKQQPKNKTRPARLSHRLDRSHAPAPTTALDDELLATMTAGYSAEVVGKAFRRIAVRASRAIGCCHVQSLDDSDVWHSDAATVVGRVPTDASTESFNEHCDGVAKSRDGMVVALDGLDELPGLLAPLPESNQLILLVLPSKQAAAAAPAIMQRVLLYWNIWQQQHSSTEARWERDSLAAILDLTLRAEACDSVGEASEMIVNELARNLDCSKVAIATMHKGQLRVQAISGVAKLERSSDSHHAFRNAMLEAQDRPEPGIWPAQNVDDDYLLLAHEQLANTVRDGAVLSQPLAAADGTRLGIWIVTGSPEQIHNPRLSQFAAAASDSLASSLQMIQRVRGSLVRRTFGWLMRKTSRLTRLIVPLAMIGVAALMLLPVTYRVRCGCLAEPVSRRFAVAPFDGLIVAGFVEPGDRVSKGDALAEIDGRSIRWELSGITAEQQQAVRQREMELADGNIPETFLAQLEKDRLTAERKVLEFQRDHLKVESPIDGIVLSGSLERAEAASIETGQVLFEIGPVSPIKLEVAIPADDIPHVHVGHPAKVWMEGLESKPFIGELKRVSPRSEIRDARNVFIAEIEVDNANESLRPGMQGHVRIDGDERSLGWTLFHKPMDWVRSRLTWW